MRFSLTHSEEEGMCSAASGPEREEAAFLHTLLLKTKVSHN